MAVFQGPYNPESAYSDVGNVVTHDDGNVYKVLRPAPAGAYPTDTRYWGKVDGITAEVMNLLVGLFSELQTAVATAQSNETKISAMIAPEYTKTTYAKGALRTHSGKLYKAKDTIGTAENWTASHWEETTVFAELSAILTSIGTLNTSVTALQGVVFDEKTLVLESSTESSTKKWAITVDDSDGLQVEEIVEEGGGT